MIAIEIENKEDLFCIQRGLELFLEKVDENIRDAAFNRLWDVVRAGAKTGESTCKLLGKIMEAQNAWK